MPKTQKNVNATSTFPKSDNTTWYTHTHTERRAQCFCLRFSTPITHIVGMLRTFFALSLWHRFICRCALSRNWGTSTTTIRSLLKLNVYSGCINNLLHTTRAAEINEKFMLNVHFLATVRCEAHVLPHSDGKHRPHSHGNGTHNPHAGR